MKSPVKRSHKSVVIASMVAALLSSGGTMAASFSRQAGSRAPDAT